MAKVVVGGVGELRLGFVVGEEVDERIKLSV